MAMDKKDQKNKPKPVQGKPVVQKPKPSGTCGPMDPKSVNKPTKG